MKQRTFTHLSEVDRVRIEVLVDEGKSYTAIAKQLGVNRSTVSREIRQRRTPTGYHSWTAQLDYQKKRHVCRPAQKLVDTPLGDYVIQRIKVGWSPQQIAGRLALEIKQGKRLAKDWVSHETIYQFVYQSEYGKKELLYQYLRRGKKRRTRKFGRKSQHDKIPNRVFIDERPRIVATRVTIGHWEADIMHYPRKLGITTLVERKARFTLLTKMSRRMATETVRALTTSLAGHYCKTLTVDNGRENTQHEYLQKRLGIRIFFCHPYHSWEKGTVENTNGLIRGYLPRQTALEEITQQELDDIADELNNRPRKTLAYQTPKEVLEYEYQKLRNVAVRD